MIWFTSNISSPSRDDHFPLFVLKVAAGLAGAIILLILAFLVIEAIPAVRHVGVGAFFADASWHPMEGLYGLIPMFWGTLLAAAGALALATPLGLLSALFCRYYAPQPLATAYRKLIELLAGIPSVVYGLWGLVVVVPILAEIHPPGPSLLAGILILTLMILPGIALTAEASLGFVPKDIIHGAAALGLKRWTIIRRVILPMAWPGLSTGIILQTGRAIGETMAILMVCGNVVQIPHSLFDPVRTLTANIALEMSYAAGDHRAALFFTGLILLGIMVALSIVAERLQEERAHG